MHSENIRLIRSRLTGIIEPEEIETLIGALLEEVTLLTEETIKSMDRDKLPPHLKSKTIEEMEVDISKLIMEQISENILLFTETATEKAKLNFKFKTGEIPAGLEKITESISKKVEFQKKWEG